MYFSLFNTHSLSFYFLLPLTVVAQFPANTLPPTNGPYKVGTTSVYLPNPAAARDIMVSIFYPTVASTNTTFAPAFDPAYAAFLDSSVGLPSGLAESVISRAYTAAPFFNPPKTWRAHPKNKNCEHPPILLFSPGYGGSRLDYTATLSNLASNGYIVVGVDHPFDTTFIAYPNGRTAFHQPLQLNETSAAEVVDLRVSDLKFVLSALSKKTNLLPGLKGKLDVNHGVGIFGHSIGGAASASSILADKRFTCGANLDGSFWGSVVSKGIQASPFMIMASQNRNSSNDASWAAFWKNSNRRGGVLELEIGVKGSQHGTYSDFAVLYGSLVDLGLLPSDPETYGTIKGERMLLIESAYLTALFDYCLNGRKQKLLKGPSSLFPEVFFLPK